MGSVRSDGWKEVRVNVPVLAGGALNDNDALLIAPLRELVR